MANPKGNPENLKPWKPGQCGNLGGRPKKHPVTDRYAAVLEKPLPDELVRLLKVKKGTTYGEAIAFGQAISAIKGKADSAREIREALEGKATQRVEVTGEAGGAIKLDLDNTLQKIREFYGIGPAAGSEKPTDTLSVSEELDRGPLPPQDSD